MIITADALTRAAGVAAVAAGVIFIGVQIGHPQLNATASSRSPQQDSSRRVMTWD
jgi:hypothetical protein